MKKLSLYIIVFLAIVSGFFIYNSFRLIKENTALKKELKETNAGYDNNIQYAIKLEDSITGFQKKVKELQAEDKFSLQGNPKAAKYLSDIDDQTDWQKYIIDTLLKTNETEGNNPLIPFDGMAGKMKITQAKILNNRWIIARFSDGTYSGEMLLRYDINKDKSIDFKVLDQTLFN